MKPQDIIVLLLFFLLISFDSKSNVQFVRDLDAYEGEIAYKVLDTEFTQESEVIPTPIECSCKGTKKVKTGDGILTIDCPCKSNCQCKKPQGSLPQANIEEELTPEFTYIFGAKWCGPCITFHDNDLPKLVRDGWKIGNKRYTRGDNIVLVDVDEDNELFSKYAESTEQQIPFYVVTRNKRKIGSKTGYMNYLEFAKWSNNVVTSTRK